MYITRLLSTRGIDLSSFSSRKIAASRERRSLDSCIIDCAGFSGAVARGEARCGTAGSVAAAV